MIGISASEKDIHVKTPTTIEPISSKEDNNLHVEIDGITYRGLPRKEEESSIEQLYIPSLLGWDVLGQLMLTIDYKNNLVKLCINDTTT